MVAKTIDEAEKAAKKDFESACLGDLRIVLTYGTDRYPTPWDSQYPTPWDSLSLYICALERRVKQLEKQLEE